MNHDDIRHEKVSTHASHAPELDDAKPVERHVAAWAHTLDIVARDGIAALDDDERVRFERALAEDAALREALEEARFALRFFAPARDFQPAREQSQRLRTSILSAIDAEASESADSSFRPVSRRTNAPLARRGQGRRWLVHAMTAAAAVVLLAVVVPSQIRQGQEAGSVTIDGQTFTAADVQAATDQMELAMAVLSRTVDRTSMIVRSEMTQELHDHVATPLQEGFGRSVNSIPYLQPVPREDEHSSRTSPPRGTDDHGLEMTGSLERT